MSLEVNVTKRFDGFTLHAAFTAGDTATALLGASGCGKSMTLRCIAILLYLRHLLLFLRLDRLISK